MCINTTDEVTRANLRKKIDAQRTQNRNHANVAPQRFLEAWIKGVTRVGEQYFCHAPLHESGLPHAAELGAVTDKRQISPNCNYIQENISSLSSGEATLLAVMCSFFNSEWGGDLMREFGLNGMADVAFKLDLEGNQIVADLLVNYTGW